MQTEKVLQLLKKYTEKSLSAGEELALQELITNSDPEARESILQQYEQVVIQAETDTADPVLLQRIKAVIKQLKSSEAEETRDATVRSMFSWRKIAVAASVILVVGFGSYFLFFNKTVKPDSIVTGDQPKDVEAPKGTKAMITLADGIVVTLDSVAGGTLARQGNVNVTKTVDGKIIYSGNANDVIYNKLTNPRGSRVIDMTLADGSRVWLNAGSSVTYPVAFVGIERKVEITGEAYFEVTHNEKKPFIVSVNGIEVRDLGTAFNINAYNDEALIKTTLVEGSVKVVKGVNNQVLVPGQQLQAGNGTNEFRLIANADVDEATAWRNRGFLFRSTDIKSIMRQLSRWYDVDVSYESVPIARFNARITRETPLSNILKALELTDEVKFRIEGKRVVVMK